MKFYYVDKNRQRVGPFTLDELRSHDVDKNTFVFFKGLTKWVRAGEVPELNDLFSQQVLPLEQQPITHANHSTMSAEASHNNHQQQALQVGTMLQNGKYNIVRILSSGSFGNTYLAQNNQTQTMVAIKEFFMAGVTQRYQNNVVGVSNLAHRPLFVEQLEKFKTDMRNLSNVHNEHVVTVYDLFEENSTAYCVMEYIDGESLDERIKRQESPLTEQEVRNSMLPQLLDALQAIHQSNILHLDIRPSNIMLDRQGNLRLIDFGACRQSRSWGVAANTEAASKAMTVGFSPREQFEQAYERFGPWTDFYALGATLYHLLTGSNPPSIVNIERQGAQAFVFNRPVGNDLQQVIAWMMQADRRLRPQSVIAINNCLTALSTGSNATALPQHPVSEQPVVQPTQHVQQAPAPKPEPVAPIQSEPQPIPQPVAPVQPEQPINSVELEQSLHDSSDNIPEGLYQREEPEVAQDPIPEAFVPSETATDVYLGYNETDESKNSTKKLLPILGAVALLAIGGGLIYAFMPKGSTSTEDLTAEQIATNTKTVEGEKMVYAVDGTSFSYTGEVNEAGEPNGQGKATWDDGRSYEGQFANGKMHGKGKYADTKHQQVFEGTMKDNYFDEGKMTYTDDNSYYEGTFKNGDPWNGTYYTADGSPTEIKEGK